MGRIVADVDGSFPLELINVVCDNGYPFVLLDESDRASAERTPAFGGPTGIRCSTAQYHGNGQAPRVVRSDE